MNICMNCGKETKNNKFCSLKCRSEWIIKESREERICVYCGKKFIVEKRKKKKLCSDACRNKYKKTNEYKKKLLLSIEKTNLNKYGEKYWFQTKEYKDGIKKKYGNEKFTNIEKAKRTKLKKYSNENYNNISKNKQTKLERYGNENYNNRNKWSKTMIKKYGSLSTQNQKEKLLEMLNKNIIGFKSEKYLEYLKNMGVSNAAQLEIVKEKKQKKRREKDYNNLYNSNKFARSTPLFTLDDYVSQEKGKLYKFKCNKCGNIFEDNIHQNHIPSCPNCYNIKIGKSLVEDEVFDFINDNLPNYKVYRNYRGLLNKKELDIYIPEKNIAIEIDGLYWHSELRGKSKNYHLDKTNECLSKHIQLIHIFDVEWIQKTNIVMGRLKNILNINNSITRIYARKCIIKEISSKEKNRFLNKFHLQGEDKSKYKLGLFYNKELISVMTFGKLRVALGNKKTSNDTYELIRFVSSNRHLVVGGASKLLSYFVKNYKPNRVISYADKRWSVGNLYNKLGFKLISNTPSNYWYVGPNRYDLIPKHRFNFRKNVLENKLKTFNKDLTEWQNMQLNGYDRIWDCGSLKYELIIN